MNDDELSQFDEAFRFGIEDAKRYFGHQWDVCDPVCWAIVRVVEAQTNLAYAINDVVCDGVDERLVEEAIKERRQAIAALQKALKREPRGFQ